MARSPRRPSAGPKDFPDLLLTPGVGARTVQALAMVAEVVHGAPCRFTDPARFSLAHGGKDRHPFPVPIKVYDETIRVLKSAVRKARLGREEELQAPAPARRAGPPARTGMADIRPNFRRHRAHCVAATGRPVRRSGWLKGPDAAEGGRLGVFEYPKQLAKPDPRQGSGWQDSDQTVAVANAIKLFA